jgi:Prolyl oligopeptidase family
VKQWISETIERGPIGALVKQATGFECQLCAALGCNPVGFLKSNDEPYVEAHHVTPVLKREIGSFASINVMTLCPNHHRQMHYGAVKVVITETTFDVVMEGTAVTTRDTHKFESRYLDWLIGPYPQEEARYRERSPLHHSERLSKPVIFFQGDEDAVVSPNQSEAMVEALRRKGSAVGYFLFSGERHGLRKAANIQRCLDAELAVYAIEVFKIGLTF